jgi:hypothetical protein
MSVLFFAKDQITAKNEVKQKKKIFFCNLLIFYERVGESDCGFQKRKTKKKEVVVDDAKQNSVINSRWSGFVPRAMCTWRVLAFRSNHEKTYIRFPRLHQNTSNLSHAAASEDSVRIFRHHVLVTTRRILHDERILEILQRFNKMNGRFICFTTGSRSPGKY